MRKISLSSNIILGIIVVILIIGISIMTVYAINDTNIDYTTATLTYDEMVGKVAVKVPEGYVLTMIPNSIVEPVVPQTTSNIVELQQLMQQCQDRMDNAHNMAESARKLGYSSDNIVIDWAGDEYTQAQDLFLIYQEQYNNLIQQEKYNKYPTAAYIWDYFHNKGYNDQVCAGILGNLIAETGGQTLNIQALTKGKGYYGMAQWSMKYYPDVVDASLEEQCEFLYNTIEQIFNTYGNRYTKGFDYSSFLELTNEKQAALAFAVCYERCGSGSYNVRQTNATKAYEYFVN